MLPRHREIPLRPLRLQEIPRPLRHPRSKCYTLLITWEMSRECLLQWPPVMMALKLTISYLEMTLLVQCLFQISPSLPRTWWRPTPLQLSLSGSCSTSRSCQPWVPTLFRFSLSAPSLSSFGSGLILPKLIRIKNRNVRQNRNVPLLICLNSI